MPVTGRRALDLDDLPHEGLRGPKVACLAVQVSQQHQFVDDAGMPLAEGHVPGVDASR